MEEILSEDYLGLGPSSGDSIRKPAAPYQSIAYTKSQFANVYITEGANYKVEEGKIVKSNTFYNEADVLRQLSYVFINPENL